MKHSKVTQGGIHDATIPGGGKRKLILTVVLLAILYCIGILLAPIVLFLSIQFNSRPIAYIFIKLYPYRVHTQYASGGNPLFYAVHKENIVITQYLLNSNVDVNSKCWYTKETPIFAAMENDSLALVKLLISHHANLATRSKSTGYTPFLTAVRYDSYNTIEYMLRYHPEYTTARGPNDDTPLHIASYYGNNNAVNLLLDRGADVDVTNEFGETPLHYAETLEIASRLISKSSDINARAVDGQTPLHRQASRLLEQPDIVRILLRNGADINAMANRGITPLHLAAISGNYESVKILCDNGADLSIRSKEMKTALD